MLTFYFRKKQHRILVKGINSEVICGLKTGSSCSKDLAEIQIYHYIMREFLSTLLKYCQKNEMTHLKQRTHAKFSNNNKFKIKERVLSV